MRDYVLGYSIAVVCLFGGASVMHNIMKPDLVCWVPYLEACRLPTSCTHTQKTTCFYVQTLPVEPPADGKEQQQTQQSSSQEQTTEQKKWCVLANWSADLFCALIVRW